MIPFFKILSLIIRTFTKPVASYFKASLKISGHERQRAQYILIFLGQKYHSFNIRLTRSLTNQGFSEYIKPLSDEKALDSGADFIGEFIAYSTLLTWGYYELNKLSRDTKIKEQKLLDQLTNLQVTVSKTSQNYRTLCLQVEKLRDELFDREKLKTQASHNKKALINP
ncbi:hypothetical protein SteCoe_12497 [Stentor coeruleus]|uniref:Uncharacterized protein n=1 Tax=Stentor coeruleus TaxID=5963 RepID=A0A1R2CAN1_9CILI|nr:hypothetical protein SteCoe_12497 [Stentor coeruleus]